MSDIPQHVTARDDYWELVDKWVNDAALEARKKGLTPKEYPIMWVNTMDAIPLYEITETGQMCRNGVPFTGAGAVIGFYVWLQHRGIL